MPDIVDIFRGKGIPAFRRGDEQYELSVATANLLYRFSRPECAVQPRSDTEVAEIIKIAKQQNKSLTIKNGGHSYAGYSTTDQGILLDLCTMKKVKLDIDSNIVTLQGGALWGHAYRELVNGGHIGYIINGGRCPNVGVSGFTLGGGLGPFTRSFGMGCDTLKEVTLITAEGKKVTVSDEHGKSTKEGKLFWALCGAGGGNFGVVVELKMYLRKLENPKGRVVAGKYTWYPKPEPTEMADFMTTMNKFYTTAWPNKMTIDSSWLCELKETKSELGVRFLVYYDGDPPDFESLIDEKINHDGLKKQLKRRSLPERSTRFLHETLVEQWSEETKKAFPSKKSYSIYSGFVFKNDPKDIQKITAIIRSEMAVFREKFVGEQALLQVTWIHAGGAAKGERSATAFRWRDGMYHTYIMIEWQEKFLELDMREFCKRMSEKLRLFSIMKHAAYINFPDGSLPTDAHEIAYYGNNYKKLQRIKETWDRKEFFKWDHGVKLPTRTSPTSAGSSKAAAEADNGVEFAKAPDKEIPGGLPTLNSEELTDNIASEQWKTYEPNPNIDFPGVAKSPYFGL